MAPRLFGLSALLLAVIACSISIQPIVPGSITPAAGVGYDRPATQIVGRVLEATSGFPLADVQVFLPGENRGTLTRADGRYALALDDALVGQEVTVRFERIGLTAEVRTFRVARGDNTVDVTMLPHPLGLDEIVLGTTAAAASRRESRAPLPYDPSRIPPQPQAERGRRSGPSARSCWRGQLHDPAPGAPRPLQPGEHRRV